MTQKDLRDLLLARIDAVSIKAILEDVVRFIADDQELETWSPDYFRELVKRIDFA